MAFDVRAHQNGVRWVIVGGVVFTAASLTGPWQQPEAVFTSTRVALTIMHIVTGSLVTFGLARGIWADDRQCYAAIDEVAGRTRGEHRAGNTACEIRRVREADRGDCE